ncbi:DNA mismatch repair protein MutS [Tanacetum coccineum]
MSECMCVKCDQKTYLVRIYPGNQQASPLVLLDEVGAGTNPLEGAALGMSLLECFAKAVGLLTMATTHHGELKTLKYSNGAFENACMEFDEVNSKPPYRILWGIPGFRPVKPILQVTTYPNQHPNSGGKLYTLSKLPTTPHPSLIKTFPTVALPQPTTPQQTTSTNSSDDLVTSNISSTT